MSPAEPLRIEVPAPTAAPLVVAVGIALSGAGVALSLVFAVVGVPLVVVGLAIWVNQWSARGAQLVEPDTTTPDEILPDPTAVPRLQVGMPGYRLRLPFEVHPVSAGIKGGLIGGLLMPLPALGWALSKGHTIWYPLNLLAGTALPGVDSMPLAELETFHPTLFGLGLAMHATLSLSLGMLYGVLLPTLPRDRLGQFAWGGFLFPALWTGFSYSLMGVVNPLLQRQVDWPWFIASQFIFGLVATVVVRMAGTIPIPPAGVGSDTESLTS